MAALQNDKKRTRKSWGLKVFFLFLLLLIVPLAWRWTPLNEWVNFETIIEWQQSVKDYPTAFYLVVGAYLLGSLFLFPVTVLNVATVLTFGPIQGNLYALSGWLASAAMGYGIGRGIGREMVTRLARSWGHRLVEPADRHRFLTVLTMRVLPVAPFTLVNFFVGAARIRFRDFFLASVIGRIPGIVLLTLGGLQSRNVFSSTGRDRPRFVGTHTGPVATRLGAVSVKAPAHHKPGWPASFSHSDQLRWSPLIVSVQIGQSLGWEFSRYGFEELRMTLNR